MRRNLSNLENNVSSKLSIIIPIGPDEAMPNSLLMQLKELLKHAEIIVICSEGKKLSCEIEDVILSSTQAGRSRQLNAGAKLASREYLWFLHADSVLSAQTEMFLAQYLHDESSLYFFNLEFLPWEKSMRAQELGALIRSEFWGMPFGDQGFILSKTFFNRLKGFPVNQRYGEDHILSWKVKQRGGRLCRIPLPLYTSARKYRNVGRLKLTLRYLKLTFLQALPEFLKNRY